VIKMAAEETGGCHTAIFYRDVHEFTDVALVLAEAGARAREAVLVVATSSSLQSLRPGLAGYGRAVTLAELTSVGTDPGRVFGIIRMFASDHRGRPVRCLQEVGWPGRHGEELAEAIRYDALVSRALAGSAARVLCGYQTQIDAEYLVSARLVHPAVLHDSAPLAGAPVGQLPAEALSRPPSSALNFNFRDDQAKVRRFAAEEARRAGLPTDRVMDLQIAAGELAANTFSHTSGLGTLTLWADQDEVVCQVSDSGHITDPLAGTFCPDPATLGSSRGLWLVHQVSDLVQVRTGPSGTTVRLHFRFP